MKYRTLRRAAGALSVALMLFTGAIGQQRERTQQVGTDRALNLLNREVRHELLMLPYYSVFDWIEYEVRSDGTVVLNGYVTSPPDTKSRAEDRVKKIEGVERVINNIEILPVSPNDDRLRNSLYRAIYSGPLFRYAVGSLNTIHIIVKNGRATLYGVVDSEMDKQLAYTNARGVPGLFEVNNRLIVQNRDDR
jgi:hyperosmotically inducible protein